MALTIWLRIYSSFLLILFFSQNFVISSVQSSGDAIALLSFKSHITYDPDGALASWGNNSLHFCNWLGVTCSNHSGNEARVTALELLGFDLAGFLSPSLGNLSFLYKLHISETRISGSIPHELGSLSNLRLLNLSHNSLVGEIPHTLSQCFLLQIISLKYNMLDGEIPSNLSLCTMLRFIDFNSNNLIGIIPASFGALKSLEVLLLHNNKLVAMKEGDWNFLTALTNCSNLKFLGLGKNSLTGLFPISVTNLSVHLKYLDLEENQIYGGFPFGIEKLVNLQELYLGINHFSGAIPPSIGEFLMLKTFDLSNNQFSGSIPPSFCNLSSLSYLNIGINNLQGGIPPCFGWNKISGNIPIEIGDLFGLNLLNLGPNNLWGTIPVGIEKLTSLQRLDLRGNGLSGKIPYNIGNLSMLDILYLDHNDLSGHIPSNLGSCKQLMQLYLQYNKFMGPIPKEILSITSLSLGIDLSNNLLTGLLSIDVGLLVNLEYLALSSNKLSGQIPSNLAQCAQLKYLYMDNNLFQGNIPSSLEALKSLELFNLSHNNLSGKIPKFLESLQNVDLSYNHLEGEVPKNGVFFNSSAFSVHGNDKLCGGIVELKLPPCLENNQVSRKNHTLTMLLATVIIITCIILLFVLSIWKRRKSKKLPSIERFEKDHNHVQVSYAELRRATNGFSSHNLIGRGSFGSVYIGNLDHNWQKSIAIKVLNLQQKGASKSFELECKALRSVRHRNLVRILTSCSSINHEGNDFKALVFEYMSNGNLDKWLHQQSIFDNDRPKKLSIIQRMNIIIDVASAVDYLHNYGPIPIVHCDLKPSNVLLDEDMVAHVSDFGLARLLIDTTKQSSQTSTSSIALKGTIGYAAPGDVYSFGIILLELFTGKRPIDEIFNEGLTLHLFVKASLPERAMDIVDPYLLLQEEDDEVGEGLRRMRVVSKSELDCIISVLTVGLHCSEESPTERIPITQAFNELYAIRNIFLKSSNDRITHL
ncbi:hypothetical protein KFK09_003445 [Dendrobium nobile]|uniref:Receptor kinase-like protein Xa21 n=1 Tax=Dendrobium nobile TaxID=94219 RepID=A0A8T3C362_DENNO|nr:hypothetical protein KFK09_003445 [Dendrobium nobile]